MAETYHDDMLDHLESERRRIVNGVNTVLEIERTGDKYLADEHRKLVISAKAACGHSPCPVADDYLGNTWPAE